MALSNISLFWMLNLTLCSINVYTKEHNAKSYHTSEKQNNLFKMTNNDRHLLWFIQISDLHLSIFHDINRIEEFREFCHSTVNAIKPLLVIASGDLTDGKSGNNIGTNQVKNEWVQYYNILNDAQIMNKTVWMDMRGNHDGFNIISLNSQENYFVNYSIQGKKHPRSYIHQLQKDGNIYSFVALDSCLNPGQRRPFHFIGFLDTLEVNAIKNITNQIETSGSNYSIWFGHFPTSAILAQYKGGVRALIGADKHTFAYLSGHFHTFGGMVPKMYTLHSEGFLELELGDWKDNRLFRLLAFDHGLLSFTDVHHKDWPIILVTNPKHALFVVPQQEDLNIIKQSSHIRILVFSLAQIEWVKVKINEEEWLFCKSTNGPLYVAKWNPDDYLQGIHTIHVNIKDINGREKYLAQPFAIDGSTLSFDFLPGIALKSDIQVWCTTAFGIMFVISVLPLCILKCLHGLVRMGKLEKPLLKKGCCRLCLRKLWILTTVNHIFWPLLLYPIYLAVGPWSVGFIIEDYWGAIFTWGIIVNGAFLPGSVTYACAFIQLLVFHIPLTIILANGIYRRFLNKVAKASNISKTVLNHVGLQLPIVLLLCCQIFIACYFLLTFGTVAFILGPVSSWSIVFACVLWYKVLVLPESCTRQAAKIWSVKLEPAPNQTYLSLPNTISSIDADSAL